MWKKILKIGYIALGLVIAVLVYLIGYNSNGFNHISKLTNKAIENKDYVELAKIHGGCFDTFNLVEENDEILDMAIFPSTTLGSVTYYDEEDKTKTVSRYDASYYIYIMNPKFDTDTKEVNGKPFNDTALRFISANGTYDYKFQIDKNINSSLYLEKPKSEAEALLNSSRDIFSTYTNWNFFNISLTRSLVNAMGLEDGIHSIEVLDRDGVVKFSYDVHLDFTQTFFTDVEPLITHYNTYIEEYNSDDKEVKNNASKKFDEFYLGEDGFEAKFKKNENYSFRHENKYLQPSSLIWQTIGILVLYLICISLFYFLLFHFSFLKGLISRRTDGKYSVNPGAKRKDTINAKTKDIQVEENKEEVDEQKGE